MNLVHYYKIGRTGEQIILSTQINYRDIVQLGNILGIKIGNRIYYRLYGEFWYKDVNTNKDYPVDFLNNIIEETMLEILLYEIFFFVIPVILIVFFGISLYRYVSAKNQNKVAPGTFSDDEVKKRKVILIVLSVISCVFVAIVIGFIALMFMSVAYM